MKFFEHVFSIKNENYYKVIRFLGFKFKFFNAKHVLKDLLLNHQPCEFLYKTYSSIWLYSSLDENFLNQAVLMYKSKYLFDIMKNEFWLFILSSFIEENMFDDADELLDKYFAKYKTLDMEKYFLVADYAYKKGIKSEKIEKAEFVYNEFQSKDKLNNFKNFIQNKKIAIIGGSGRELNKNKGFEIDSHDIVIRFNNYPEDEKYYKDYGKKTTIWVRQGSKDTLHKPDISKFDFIIWGDDKKRVSIKNNHLDIMYDYFKNFPNKLIEIENSCYEEFRKETSINYPTTGTILIWWLNSILGNLNNVDVYGFAFLDKNPNDNSHYFDNVSNMQKVHRFDKEVSFLYDFYNKNRVTL